LCSSRLFRVAGKISLLLRISLMIREFRRLSGSTITACAGRDRGLGTTAVDRWPKGSVEGAASRRFRHGDGGGRSVRSQLAG
jgi:hypothetical protein